MLPSTLDGLSTGEMAARPVGTVDSAGLHDVLPSGVLAGVIEGARWGSVVGDG